MKREPLTEQEYWKLKYIIEHENRLHIEKELLERRYKELMESDMSRVREDRMAAMSTIARRVEAGGSPADWNVSIDGPHNSYIEFKDDDKSGAVEAQEG